jgi:signal transduction histidine kinase
MARRLLDEVMGGVNFGLDGWYHAVEYRDAQGFPIPHDEGPLARAFRGEVIKDEIIGLHFRDTSITRYFRANLLPIQEHRHVTHVIICGIDTSEEVRFENLKRDFLVTLAHELKTPLSVIRGYADYLTQQRSELSSEHIRHIDAIKRRSEHMDRIIGNLLDLASIELGRLVFIPQRVELVRLVRNIVDEARQTHPQRQFDLEMRADVAWVHGDRARLEQVIRELLANGIRFSPKTSPIKIVLSTSSRDREVVIAIEDRGIGIPEPLIDKLFEPFFRAHAGTEHDHGGLGIGLFLAREIIRRHGGDVWIESKEHHGTTALVTLPLMPT